jgi:hypothetical protein
VARDGQLTLPMPMPGRGRERALRVKRGDVRVLDDVLAEIAAGPMPGKHGPGRQWPASAKSMTAARMQSRARMTTPIIGSVLLAASCRPMPPVLHLMNPQRYRSPEAAGRGRSPRSGRMALFRPACGPVPPGLPGGGWI